LKSDLETFFQNYKDALEKYNFKPQYIFNCDETMLNMGKDFKKALCDENGDPTIELECKMSEHITLLLCISATGFWLKPLAIFPCVFVPEFAASVHEEFNMTGQTNGWIDGNIFRNYIELFFADEVNKLRVKNGEPNEPALLILDHHSSRDAINAEQLWITSKILLLLIPPHSSHITQPLDLSVNGEFKTKLRERIKQIPNETAAIRRNRLMQITARVLSRVHNKDCILTGWERSGLWPYNPEVAYKSTAVVETYEQLPSTYSATKKEKKREKNEWRSTYF
jgi:hypothetical protein